MDSMIVHPGTLTHNGQFPESIHVDMGYYGFSKRIPLFTWGAVSCLNIVVHRCDNDSGALAHVPHDSLDQAALYKSAWTALSMMLDACGFNPDDKATPYKFDIYLLAGQAFIPDSHFAPENPQRETVLDFLRQHLGNELTRNRFNFWHGLVREFGAVCYAPQRALVYGLDDKEVTVLQKKMTTTTVITTINIIDRIARKSWLVKLRPDVPQK